MQGRRLPAAAVRTTTPDYYAETGPYYPTSYDPSSGSGWTWRGVLTGLVIVLAIALLFVVTYGLHLLFGPE